MSPRVLPADLPTPTHPPPPPRWPTAQWETNRLPGDLSTGEVLVPLSLPYGEHFFQTLNTLGSHGHPREEFVYSQHSPHVFIWVLPNEVGAPPPAQTESPMGFASLFTVF